MDTSKPEMIRMDIHLFMRALYRNPPVQLRASLRLAPVRLPPHFGLHRHDRA